LIECALIITEVGPKGKGAFWTQAHAIRIVGVDAKVVEKAFAVGKQANTDPASIAYPTAIAQEIALVIVIKRYRLVSVKQIDV